MSVVLTFHQPDFSTVERAKEYLLHRPNYSHIGELVDHDNADTGCGFSVAFNSSPDSAVLEPGGPALGFLLNYNRPKPFIREAIAEVSAFNKVFPGPFYNEETCQIEPFDAERFFADWSRANDDYVRKLARETGWYQVLAPRHVIEQVWAWNSHRWALQTSADEDVYVAPVMWLKTSSSGPIPHIIWTYSLRTLFPVFVENFILATPKNELQSQDTISEEPEFEFRIVPRETVRATAVFDMQIINGTSANCTPFNIPGSLLNAVADIAPEEPGADKIIHPSFVLEAEMLEST